MTAIVFKDTARGLLGDLGPTVVAILCTQGYSARIVLALKALESGCLRNGKMVDKWSAPVIVHDFDMSRKHQNWLKIICCLLFIEKLFVPHIVPPKKTIQTLSCWPGYSWTWSQSSEVSAHKVHSSAAPSTVRIIVVHPVNKRTLNLMGVTVLWRDVYLVPQFKFYVLSFLTTHIYTYQDKWGNRKNRKKDSCSACRFFGFRPEETSVTLALTCRIRLDFSLSATF